MVELTVALGKHHAMNKYSDPGDHSTGVSIGINRSLMIPSIPQFLSSDKAVSIKISDEWLKHSG